MSATGFGIYFVRAACCDRWFSGSSSRDCGNQETVGKIGVEMARALGDLLHDEHGSELLGDGRRSEERIFVGGASYATI